MKAITVYRSISELGNIPEGAFCHVTIGAFDGIHLGHRELLRRTVESAKEIDAIPTVFTFANHPLSLLAPVYSPSALTSDETRTELFAKLGVRMAVIVKFDHAIADMSPEEFAHDTLSKRLKARRVICGYNFRFGKDGAGNADSLRELGKKLGFTVESVPPVKIENEIVSSTKIRELLNQGFVDRAAKFLGRRYSLPAIVVKGAGRGARLGFPTANLAFPEGLLIPAAGVYAAQVSVDAKFYKGMLNIGYNPTFPPERFSSEVHLFDFRENLLGKKIEVLFVKRIRDEIRFDTEKELVEQLKKDEKTAGRILDILSRRS